MSLDFSHSRNRIHPEKKQHILELIISGTMFNLTVEKIYSEYEVMMRMLETLNTFSRLVDLNILLILLIKMFSLHDIKCGKRVDVDEQPLLEDYWRGRI